MVNRAHAFAREELVRALTAYTGITTVDGAVDGTTMIDSNLVGRNDFLTEHTVLIMSGPARDETEGVLSFNSGTGEITLQRTGFTTQIKAGIEYRILNIRTVEVHVSTIDAKIGTPTDPPGTTTLFARLGKLAGATPVSGSVTANWKSGIATSGEDGADLVTIGANDTRYKLHSLLVDINAVTDGAKISIKLFMQVNGTERKLYEETFIKGTDPDGCWVVNGTVGIHEALRVEVESNTATDDGKSIAYDYMLEAM
ncbi:hypothetical protein ES703_86055 [subsurface metagenome]